MATIEEALRERKNPDMRTSPIFDDSSDSDSDIDRFDIHQEKERKKGNTRITK